MPTPRVSPSGPVGSYRKSLLLTTVQHNPVGANGATISQTDAFFDLGISLESPVIVTYNGIFADARPELVFSGRVVDNLGTIQVVIANVSPNPILMPVGGYNVTILVLKG